MRPLALTTIVVASDPEDDGLAPALQSATRLAQLAGAKLYIVSGTERRDESDQSVRAQLQRAGLNADVADEIIVRSGPPGAVVGQEARRLSADVVVLGPHRAPEQGFAGSTADRIVYTAATPCLILPVELPLPLRRILVPIDSSDGARGALAVAMRWASALRPRGETAELLVLHVTPYIEDDQHNQDAVRNEVEMVRQQLADAARVDIRTLVKEGEGAADTILEIARDSTTELLVIGTRRTSISTAAMIGSVSSAVARASPGPVLLVPPEVWTGGT